MNWYVFFKKFVAENDFMHSLYFDAKNDELTFFNSKYPEKGRESFQFKNGQFIIHELYGLTHEQTDLIINFFNESNREIILTVDPEWYQDIAETERNIFIEI